LPRKKRLTSRRFFGWLEEMEEMEAILLHYILIGNIRKIE